MCLVRLHGRRHQVRNHGHRTSDIRPYLCQLHHHRQIARFGWGIGQVPECVPRKFPQQAILIRMRKALSRTYRCIYKMSGNHFGPHFPTSILAVIHSRLRSSTPSHTEQDRLHVARENASIERRLQHLKLIPLVEHSFDRAYVLVHSSDRTPPIRE
jgi:hypothetical protein